MIAAPPGSLTDADLALLAELIEIPSAPWCEHAVQARIERALGGQPRPRYDAIGNLVLRIPGAGPRVLVLAHADETGLHVAHVWPDGSLAIRPAGNVDDRSLPGRHVRVLTDQGPIPGVIASDPPHLAFARRPADGATHWTELRVDVGARSAEEARRLGVAVPQPVVRPRRLRLLNGRRLVGRGLDDRMGCLVLIKLAALAREKRLPCDLTLAWTVQDETGLRGARDLASQERFDCVLQLDAFTMADNPHAPEALTYARLGQGPVLRERDDGFVASEGLLEWVATIAERHGVPYQVAPTRGMSEAREFQPYGAHALSINLPVRYGHTDVEQIDRADLESLVRLVVAAVAAADERGWIGA